MQLVEKVYFACMPGRVGSRQSNAVLPQGEMAKFCVFQWEWETPCLSWDLAFIYFPHDKFSAGCGIFYCSDVLLELGTKKGFTKDVTA